MNPLPLYTDAPTMLFLEINKRCNLRCSHCEFWKRAENESDWAFPDEPSTARLLGEFKQIGGQSIAICGGEPLLDYHKYMMVCEVAHGLGLSVYSEINGTAPPTKLKDALFSEHLITDGPTHLAISFDDFRESEHDEFRGRRGAYRRALEFLKELISLKASLTSAGVEVANKSIGVSYLVHGGNYLELTRAYKWANALGVPLRLRFLQPSFGLSEKKPDTTFSRYGGMDVERLTTELMVCAAENQIAFHSEWLRAVMDYAFNLTARHPYELTKGWLSSMETNNQICSSYERNIMVSVTGFARLCWSNTFRGERVTERGQLTEFWTKANDVRLAMSRCKKPCGIEHIRRVDYQSTTNTK